jgi:hypothetical protein
MQTMIKSNIRRAILAIVLMSGLALSAVSAFAETVVLTGTVDAINTLAVTPTAAATFHVTNAGRVETKVADVVETSNITAGYTVTLLSTSTQSGTAFQLKSATTGSDTPITYTVKYGTSGSPSAVTIDTQNVAATVTDASGPTGTGGNTPANKVLNITISSGTWNAATNYTDTITLTIAGK